MPARTPTITQGDARDARAVPDAETGLRPASGLLGLWGAVLAAQREVKAVEKRSLDEFTKTVGGRARPYASMEDIVHEGLRALHSHGVAMSVVGGERLPAAEGRPEWERVHYVLAHPESGESVSLHHDVPVVPKKGMPDDKAGGASYTYARGYIMLGLLGMRRVDASAPEPDARDDRDYDPDASLYDRASEAVGGAMDLKRLEVCLAAAEGMHRKGKFTRRQMDELKSLAQAAKDRLSNGGGVKA